MSIESVINDWVVLYPEEFRLIFSGVVSSLVKDIGDGKRSAINVGVLISACLADSGDVDEYIKEFVDEYGDK